MGNPPPLDFTAGTAMQNACLTAALQTMPYRSSCGVYGCIFDHACLGLYRLKALVGLLVPPFFRQDLCPRSGQVFRFAAIFPRRSINGSCGTRITSLRGRSSTAISVITTENETARSHTE